MIPPIGPVGKSLEARVGTAQSYSASWLSQRPHMQSGGRGTSVHDGGYGSRAVGGKICRTTVKVFILSSMPENRIRMSNLNSSPATSLSSFPSVAPNRRAFKLPTPFGTIVPIEVRLSDVFRRLAFCWWKRGKVLQLRKNAQL
jgi:hypothetical protein